MTNSPRAAQGGRDEGRLWDALMGEIDEAVGESLRPIGEPLASYEKQPVSAPLAVSICV